jgi:N-acetylglucosaminyl-diphospho-decaprenol L-rhamnosyltransferase
MLHEPQAIRAAKHGGAGGPDHHRLSVVIVTYRSASVIAQCLNAVGQAAPDGSMELIIVDNASGDDTVAVARSAAPDAKIIEQDRNGGFAGGCAAGASVARGRWLLFLNPDTVIAADAVKALLGCAAGRPSAGIIGGRFVDENGNADLTSWWGKPSPWSATCFALGLNSLLAGIPFFNPEAPRPWSSLPDEVRAVPVVSGAFMLVRRDLWHELGGFDPAFFMYGEDADFCLRAARAGCQPLVTAAAVCRHAGGKSSSSLQKLVLLFTGKCTLVHRHFPRGLRGAGVRLLLTGVFLRATASKRVSLRPARSARARTRGEDWRALWEKRAEWRHGWTSSALRSRSHH